MLLSRAVGYSIALVLVLAPTHRAQSHIEGKIGAVHFKGLKRFTAAQLLPIVEPPIGSDFDQFVKLANSSQESLR